MLKDTNASMYDFMLSGSDYTDGNAITFFGKNISFVTLLSEIERVGLALLERGIKKGDSVCICLPSIPQNLVAIYAVNKVGAIANMAHPLVNSLGLRNILMETNSKLLFAEEGLYHRYEADIKDLNVPTVICSLADNLSGIVKFGYKLKQKKAGAKPVAYDRNIVNYRDLGATTAHEYPEVSGDEDAVYLHSGGSTGLPKSIVLSNRAVNETCKGLDDTLDHPFNRNEVLFSVLPSFHGFGLAVCVHLCLSTRARIVLVPQFNAKQAVKLIKTQGITAMIGVPQMLKKLMDEPSFKGKNICTLKQVYCGGDKVDLKTIDAFNKRMKEAGASAEVCEGYGLTETVTVTAVNKRGEVKNGTCGRILSNAKIIITDDDGNPLPAGEKGEITVSGPMVMKRYLGDEKATREVLHTDADGVVWVKTGDVGFIDDEGFLTFVNRKKRMIIISGYNIYPAEIEARAAELDEVRECFAVEGRKDGKTIAALFVTLNEGYSPSDALTDKLSAHLARTLTRWSTPKKIIVLDAFPLTDLGKVDVLTLEKMARG